MSRGSGGTDWNRRQLNEQEAMMVRRLRKLLQRLRSAVLFGTSALDPLTFAAVPLLLVVVALGASYIPAWRATRVDPMVALRYE